MTEPTPLTLYVGQTYLVTPTAAPAVFEDSGGIAPIPWSQNDGRWRHSEYAPGFTFGQAGCLVCCVAMVASLAYPTEAPTPLEVAARLRAVWAFDGGLLTRPARIAQAYQRLTWGGAVHWRYMPAQLDMVAQEIADYGATVLEVAWNPKSSQRPDQGNQHFVLATGVRGGSAPDVQIVDPWDGLAKWLTESPYARPAGWTAARAVHGIRLVRPDGG